MRKKKHKKKNKNMKKREIQKMQVENQQEVLGADVDKNQVENQQEILVDAAEKEQRRTTRLGAIIAIVAVIGTLCAFLFKMTISSLNVWSEQGVMYWYLQALFSFALSTSVIIFIDIVLYVISDLKRYNTLDQNYKQYDQESDNRYMYLLRNAFMCMKDYGAKKGIGKIRIIHLIGQKVSFARRSICLCMRILIWKEQEYC